MRASGWHTLCLKRRGNPFTGRSNRIRVDLPDAADSLAFAFAGGRFMQWVFGQRICGVCTGVHAIASIRRRRERSRRESSAQCAPASQPDDFRAGGAAVRATRSKERQ